MIASVSARPHPFLTPGRPLVFAHRGGAALAPENTMPAFDQAIALGADGVELDVRLSRDGVVVVHHDARVDRTTNGRGRVSDRTASELARLDAAYRFGGPWRGTGVGIPTLADVLRRHREAWVIVEMKQDRVELAHATVAVVRAAGAADRVCLAASGLRAITAARRAAPEIMTSAAREEVRVALTGRWLGHDYQGFQVPERVGAVQIVSGAFVARAHRHGLFVQVWTVNRPEGLRRMIDLGVDGLITDRPDLALTVVRDTRTTAATGCGNDRAHRRPGADGA